MNDLYDNLQTCHFKHSLKMGNDRCDEVLLVVVFAKEQHTLEVAILLIDAVKERLPRAENSIHDD